MDIPKKRLFQTKLITKEMLTSKVVLLGFEVFEEPFMFLPGQFVNIKVNDNNYRSYSICSDSSDSKYFQIFASIEHDGIGSNYLRSLNIGDLVECIGPSGNFLLPETLSSSIVMIATGTGISPLFSMLDYLNSINCKSHIKLFWGIRDETELFLVDKLIKYKLSLMNFEYTICFSQHTPNEFINGTTGRVTQHLAIDINAQYFLCGNPNMIHEVISTLSAKGIMPENIFHEKFTVSTPSKGI